jgi:AcrR family transcriptional regulator
MKDNALFKTLLLDSVGGEPTKGQLRQAQILEAAIKNFATVGVENTTPDKIAKTCKISRPLVLHYFKDVEEIFQIAVKVIRAEFQRLAVVAIEKETNPTGRLKAYVHSSLDWVEKRPLHVKVWLLFFYRCGLRDADRKLNSELVNMGHDRIAALLEQGKELGVFHYEDATSTAKMIQNVITGALICHMTEVQSPRLATVRAETTRTCFLLAGVKASKLLK